MASNYFGFSEDDTVTGIRLKYVRRYQLNEDIIYNILHPGHGYVKHKFASLDEVLNTVWNLCDSTIPLKHVWRYILESNT